MTTPPGNSKALPPPLLRLRDNLRHLDRTLSNLRIGMAFESPFTAREWLTACADLSPEQPGVAPLEGCADCARQKYQRLLSFDPAGIGGCRICLCSPDASSFAVLDCLEELVKATFEIHELGSREKPLLEELGASFETIDTLYETSLDLHSHDSLQKVTNRLLDRSVAAAQDISAVLWVVEAEDLVAIAQRRSEAPSPRQKSQGLLGRARHAGAPTVVDGCNPGMVDADFDPELRGSGPIVVIPVHARQGLEAVLEVWRKSGKPPFETPAIRVLEAIAVQAASAIESDRLHRDAADIERMRRMREEIKIVASIQQHLLFGKHPEQLAGGECGHRMIPSHLVAGDFYAFVRHSDACIDVILGDVMGKGILAALIGAATKIAVLRVIAESKIGRDPDRLPQPAEIVTAVNHEMSSQLVQMDSFVTLFYARFDFQKKTFTYVDAGHTETLHYIRETGSIDRLHGVGFPLGFSGTETYQQSAVQMGAGDIIFAYSDGMPEATDPQGLPYEADRITAYLQRHALCDAAEIARGISADVIAHRATDEFDDDLTCVVIKIATPAEARAAGASSNLVVMGQLDQLEPLRDWLANTVRTNSPVAVADDTVFSLQLAVQEAATNIIYHGLEPGGAQEISVSARFAGSRLQLELVYEGSAFSGENVPDPSFDGSRDHGFGLFLIDQLMDEVGYLYANGHNTVRLSKELNCPKEQTP